MHHRNTPLTFARLLMTVSLISLGATICGCGTAKISARREISSVPAATPTVIYIADFELNAASIHSESGLLPSPAAAPGPLAQLLPALPGKAKDPQALAKSLVDTLSASLEKKLVQAGLSARRLGPPGALPKSGWLVRGVFTEVNQGNQLRRAVIGFGAGKTDLQVLVDVNDLGQGAPKPFYEIRTAADSGKAPGAGPMIVLGPAGVAARFVLAGKDLDRNIQHTAAKIAEQVAQRARTTPLLSSQP